MAPEAAPTAINWLTAFWVPFGAAALGGMLSAGGAVAAIAWQSAEQKRSRDHTAIDLFIHLLKEQARYLAKISDYKVTQGQFSFIDAEKMLGVFQAFERNREWLVWVKDEALRSRVSEQLSDNNIWAFSMKAQASAVSNNNAFAAGVLTGSAEWVAAQQRAQQAQNFFDALFPDVTKLRDDTLALIDELNKRP